ncbi:MAG: phosphoribosylaminoimidazolesuccinocarboxamide synthase [Caldisericia bacterium]|nr:phosphoribosylaminoimidazolesuccinocarboxamide synthase [Caldisericia bacterium]
MNNAVLKTQFNLEGVSLFRRGKVRDVYDLGEFLLIVSTDRLSAFDVIMNEPIPDKGKMLTSLSKFWFNHLGSVAPNHYVGTDIIERYPVFRQVSSLVDGRSMIVKKAKVIPFECIVRGYLMGSAYREYLKSGTIFGDKAPENLKKGYKFDEPIFTPSTKAEEGHDENISFELMKSSIGSLAETLKSYSLKLFEEATNYAITKGIVIADTKFEFGIIDDEIIVIDEIFTPDSSRFILKEDYDNGFVDKSMDKEFVRNYLSSIKWNKEPPAPTIPEEIINKTQSRYREITKMIIGN